MGEWNNYFGVLLKKCSPAVICSSEGAVLAKSESITVSNVVRFLFKKKKISDCDVGILAKVSSSCTRNRDLRSRI